MARYRIRVAFKRGSWVDPDEAAVMLYELCAREVHAEVWFEDVAFVACGNACPSIRAWCLEPDVQQRGHAWECTDLPISQPLRALEILDEMRRSPAPYHISVAECALPKRWVDAIESDADCMRPESWTGVFCSQFALLFVRRCALEGILAAPPARWSLLWSVSSKGCLPSRLRVILDAMLRP
jgi:hypothetical protein